MNKTRFIHLFGVACLATLIQTTQTFAETDIVKDGEPKARIIISEKPTRMQRLAAFELRDYVKKISGAELPIASAPATDGTVNVFVGDSPAAKAKGVTSEGLEFGAYRMASGKDWLALVGDDANFEPIEPWARYYGQQKEVLAKWDAMTGEKWYNELAVWLSRDYSGKPVDYGKDDDGKQTRSDQIQFWKYDGRGSLNAVHAFLRSLGVRWYMPGDLGEIVPTTKTIALPDVNKTVHPDVKIRNMNWDRYYALSRDQLMWSLRLGLRTQFGPMHHGVENITIRDEQRKRHPEFYQVRNGKHDTESRYPNACLSNPELFKQNVAYVRTMFDMYDVPMVSVMPQDGLGVICQCDQCVGKETPDRRGTGRFSDYVWEYVNNVAKEVAKSHPNGKIICAAYSAYQLPPLKIEKLEPNVHVQITNGLPRTQLDPAFHHEVADLRTAWLEKCDGPLSITMNYHFDYLPFYVPHVIAKGLRDAKGQIWQEDCWFHPFSKEGLFKPGVNHLAVYVMANMWWNQDLDVDALLDEYYRLFYGPAKDEMKAFIEYCENNYADLKKDKDKVNRAFELFESAKKKVDPDSVHGKRIALVDECLNEWRKRKAQLGKGRAKDVPVYDNLIDFAQDKWRNARDTLVLDGKLDEPFWRAYPSEVGLREIQTGNDPAFATRFIARWFKDSLYLGIYCQDAPGASPKISTRKNGDWAIWDGDVVEILLETADHAYYQIVVNPAGAILDLDRGVGQADWDAWDSQADVATHVGDGFWSVEIRIPVTTSNTDPLHQVIGRAPSADMPWFFNVCRKRAREKGGELTAFSPTGKKDFHVTDRFGKLYIR